MQALRFFLPIVMSLRRCPFHAVFIVPFRIGLIFLGSSIPSARPFAVPVPEAPN